MGRGRRVGCEAVKLGRSEGSGRPGSQGSGRSWDRGRPGGWGGQPDGVAGGGREVREGLGSGGLNSRIVIIKNETENLFFSARETIRLFTCGIRSWGERGLRFLPMPPLPSPCRGRCVDLKKRVRAVLGRRMGPARVPPGAARSPAAVRSLWRDAVGGIIPVSARGRIPRPGGARPRPC